MKKKGSAIACGMHTLSMEGPKPCIFVSYYIPQTHIRGADTGFRKGGGGVRLTDNDNDNDNDNDFIHFLNMRHRKYSVIQCYIYSMSMIMRFTQPDVKSEHQV